MKLIVGLGNPGEKYEKTRHNLGFMIVEKFLKDFESVKNTIWKDSVKFKSEISQIEWQPKHGNLEKVILAKPKTYMNNSGMAVRLISDFYKINSSDVWILHDDIDLPLGSMKIRFGGASAGHHGVESVMEHLGTDRFWRFRLGIGEQKSPLRQGSEGQAKIKNQKLRNVEDFVLSDFTGSEKGKLKNLVKRGVNAVETSLENGMDAAMNRFNTK
ncbi:MAG: aminoacyl-tRNA hydrolase [Candidatus Levybacteria bacterium RIFCSPLOWO2_12_FULL_37_14]|nr:MAG: aminoacyl-tRNA hydrolase [Candidatus Levybacteria bacterium RIFCSPLOWO2_12_FULL_37_14]